MMAVIGNYALFFLKAIYLVLPGGFANMAPVFVKNHFRRLAVPVDFGYKLKGRPLFGKNKTYRGFIFAIAASIVVSYAQYFLYSFDAFRKISIIDYQAYAAFPLVFGFLVGFGVMLGDLVESFFKRRLGIKPGELFFPFDQIDSLIGGLLFAYLVVPIPLSYVILLLFLAPLLHLFANYIGFILGIKKNKF